MDRAAKIWEQDMLARVLFLITSLGEQGCLLAPHVFTAWVGGDSGLVKGHENHLTLCS